MKVNRKSMSRQPFWGRPQTGTWTNSSSNQSQSVSSTNGCCSLNMHFFFPPLSSNVVGAWHLRPTFQSFTLKKGFGCPLIVANSYNFITYWHYLRGNYSKKTSTFHFKCHWSQRLPYHERQSYA